MKKMKPPFRKSPVYKAKRKILFLGAFKRWARNNPAEFYAVSERYRMQTGREPFKIQAQ